MNNQNIFKGFTEKLRIKLEEYNQNSECFIFCVCDLEYSSDRLEGEYKFNIHSTELQQKLGEIIVVNGGKMSNPKAIRFSKFPFILKNEGTRNYKSWIKIRKKYLVELNKTNKTKTVEFPDVNYNDDYIKRHYGKEVNFEILDAYALNRALGGTGLKHCPFKDVWEVDKEEIEKAKEKNKAIFKASGDALKEINQILSENNIDIKTSEIDWMDVLPNWCSCEVKEFGNKENDTLFKRHINSCLWREASEINAFKDKVIEAIKWGVGRFNSAKSSSESNSTSQTDNQTDNSNETNNLETNISDNNNTAEELREESDRLKPTAQKVEENLKKAQNPNATIHDKKEALDELEKNMGEPAYEENKNQIKETKQSVAKDNPNEYRNNVISNLDKKLSDSELKENDLDEATKQEIKDLKNDSKLEPDKLVETEMKLAEKLNQAEAKKKMDDLVKKVEKVLKKKDQVQIEKLKVKLLEIINSHNVYYSPYKFRAEQLLKQLESSSNLNNNSQSSNSLPLSVKIVLAFGIILIASLILIFAIWKKNRKHE